MKNDVARRNLIVARQTIEHFDHAVGDPSGPYRPWGQYPRLVLADDPDAGGAVLEQDGADRHGERLRGLGACAGEPHEHVRPQDAFRIIDDRPDLSEARRGGRDDRDHSALVRLFGGGRLNDD